MSKKNKNKNRAPVNTEAENEEALEAVETTAEEEIAEESAAPEAEAAPAKKEKDAKKAKKKDKKPGFFSRVWKKIKEIFSELKRVTWPSFRTVIKQTCVVLVVVVFFLVLIFGVDLGFSALYKLLFPTA